METIRDNRSHESLSISGALLSRVIQSIAIAAALVLSVPETTLASATCGNGIIDPSEECDGAELNGNSCTTFGFAGGSLRCGSDCRLVFTSCTGGCGNEAIEPGEDCDGTALQQSCESLGYTLGGTLICTACSFDSTACVGERDDCSMASTLNDPLAGGDWQSASTWKPAKLPCPGAAVDLGTCLNAKVTFGAGESPGAGAVKIGEGCTLEIGADFRLLGKMEISKSQTMLPPGALKILSRVTSGGSTNSVIESGGLVEIYGILAVPLNSRGAPTGEGHVKIDHAAAIESPLLNGNTLTWSGIALGSAGTRIVNSGQMRFEGLSAGIRSSVPGPEFENGGTLTIHFDFDENPALFAGVYRGAGDIVLEKGKLELFSHDMGVAAKAPPSIGGRVSIAAGTSLLLSGGAGSPYSRPTTLTGTMEGDGPVTIRNGGLRVAGNWTLTGPVLLEQDAKLLVARDMQLPTLQVGAPGEGGQGTVALEGPTTLEVDGLMTVYRGAFIAMSGGLPLTIQPDTYTGPAGRVVANGGVDYRPPGGVGFGQFIVDGTTFDNLGDFSWLSGSEMRLKGAVFRNGARSLCECSGDTCVCNPEPAKFWLDGSPSGPLFRYVNSDYPTSTFLNDGGSLKIGPDASLSIAANIVPQQAAGSSGVLGRLEAVSAVKVTGGTLYGSGTIGANVHVSGGTVAPGGSISTGQLTVEGNYRQNGATLSIDLAADTDFDRLLVTGSATSESPAGLSSAVLGAFDPRGKTFRFLTSGGGRTTFFSPVTYPPCCGDVGRVTYTADSSTLDFSPLPTATPTPTPASTPTPLATSTPLPTSTPGASSCGNGVVSGVEQCDDGNRLDGDCCSASCTFETAGFTCGSGLVGCTDHQCDATGSCAAIPIPDSDGDGLCDAIDPCTILDPGQFFGSRTKLIFGKVGNDPVQGNELVQFTGTFRLPPSLSFADLDPGSLGFTLVARSLPSNAPVVDAWLPGVTLGSDGSLRGWRTNSRRTTWQYLDKSGGPTAGIELVKLVDKSSGARGGLVQVQVKGKNGFYDLPASAQSVTLDVVPGAGFLAAQGGCGEVSFGSGCVFNAPKTSMTCRVP